MEYKYIVNPMTNRKCRVDSAMGKKVIRMYKKALNGGGKRSRDDDESEMISTKRHREQFLRLKKRSRDHVPSEMPSTKRRTVSTTYPEQPDIVGYVHKDFFKNTDPSKIWNNINPNIFDGEFVHITDKPVQNVSTEPIRLYFIDKSIEGVNMYAYVENPQNPSKGYIDIFVEFNRDLDYGRDIHRLFYKEDIYGADAVNDDDNYDDEDKFILPNPGKGVKYGQYYLALSNYPGWEEDKRAFDGIYDIELGLDENSWSNKNYRWLFNDSSEEWNLKRYLDTGEKPDQ